MSINFNELNRDGPVKTKEQILAEMKRWKRPMTRQPHYFYDGSARGDMAHFILSTEPEDFEDVPF